MCFADLVVGGQVYSYESVFEVRFYFETPTKCISGSIIVKAAAALGISTLFRKEPDLSQTFIFDIILDLYDVQ